MQNNARVTLFQARLIYDPKVSVFDNGSSTKLVVAVKTKRKKDPQSANYNEKYPYEDDIYVVDVKGTYGESIAKLVKKNSLVNVEGEFALNIWMDKQGNEHRDMKVEASAVNVIFQGGYQRQNNGQNNSGNTRQRQNTQQQDNEEEFSLF